MKSLEGHPATDLRIQKTKYFSDFAAHHLIEMRQLKKGKLISQGGEGWRNVGEHNLLAGIVTKKLSELIGLSERDRIEVTSVATTHDWDKRLDKENAKLAEIQTREGIIIVQADTDKTVQRENAKVGLVRVTGGDWRDFATWGIKEKILRYIDSSLDQTSDGHADFVPWQIRLKNLGKRNPKINIEGGKIYGEGVLLYDKLGEITRQIQNELYKLIVTRRPELKRKYSKPEMLTQLLNDQIKQDIKKY